MAAAKALVDVNSHSGLVFATRSPKKRRTRSRRPTSGSTCSNCAIRVSRAAARRPSSRKCAWRWKNKRCCRDRICCFDLVNCDCVCHGNAAYKRQRRPCMRSSMFLDFATPYMIRCCANGRDSCHICFGVAGICAVCFTSGGHLCAIGSCCGGAFSGPSRVAEVCCGCVFGGGAVSWKVVGATAV